MSHRETVKQADATVEARLLRLLGREPEWMYQERYNRALQWLSRWHAPDSALHQALAGHRLFWAWWVNDWQNRDNDLSQRLETDNLGRAIYSPNPPAALVIFRERGPLEDFYLALHNPQKTSITVPSFIMEEVKRELRKKQTETTLSTISQPQPPTK